MKTLTILTVILLWSNLLMSQTTNSVYRNIAPSPNSCALAEYVETPVSLYTGTPNIDIPIYTIETGPYKFPITLSYHASGIKVAQEASWVGLGWCLNAGGAVMRTIKGWDDLNGGYYENDKEIPNAVNESASNGYVVCGTLEGYGQLFTLRLKKDAEPDVFYYNFLGYSGRFYPKLGGIRQPTGDGFICSNPEHNLKIEPLTYAYDGGFKITDTNGIQYFFAQPEIKKSFFVYKRFASMSDRYGPWGNSGIPIRDLNYRNMTTAWYLKDIRYPNGDVITFIYEEESNAYLSPISVSQSIYKVMQSWGTGDMNKSDDATYSADLTVEYPRLKKIQWKSGSIVFESSRRWDVRSLYDYNNASGLIFCTQPEKLDIIKIYSNTESNPIKTYRLYTSYFVSPGYTPEPAWNQRRDNCLGLRLKLDSISVKGIGERTNKYRMGYNLDKPLPEKNSFECDHWGYYNGRKNNCLYASAVADRDYEGLDHNVLITKGTSYPGADRSTWPLHAISSMLTSLETPEGGVTEYKYEAKSVSGNEIIKVETDQSVFYEWYDYRKPALEHIVTSDFYMPEDGYIDVEFRYAGSVFHKEQEKATSILSISGRYFFKAKDLDGDHKIHAKKLFCSKGRNTLIMQSNTLQVESTAKIWVYTYPCVYRGGPLAGGVRIAEIKSPVSMKRFKYYNSGILIRKPINLSRQVLQSFSPILEDGELGRYVQTGASVFMSQSSSSTVPLESPTAGVPVGYSQVYVATTTPQEELCEEFYYYNRKETEDTRIGFPGEFIFTNGKLKRHNIYDKDRKLLQKSYYTYYTKNIGNLRAMKEDPYSCGIISFYNIPIAHCRLTSQSDTIYDTNSKFNSNYTYYNYNDKNLQIYETIKSGQHQRTVQRKLFTDDLKDISPYKEMCASNLRCVPIEESFFKGYNVATTVLTQKSLHSYKKNSKNDKQFIPEADYIYYHPSGQAEPPYFTGDKSLFGSPEYTYKDYDPSGNSTSIQSRMGQSAVYIWGYKRQYLIAQIFNATAEEVAAQGIDIDGIGNDNQPTEAQWQALHALRSRLPNAEVTVMTYRPLIGISSKTDAKGITTYYEYDDMGRLNCIRDNNRNIMNTYEYKLATDL